MAALLFELLSEEIPARMQARAATELKRLVRINSGKRIRLVRRSCQIGNQDLLRASRSGRVISRAKKDRKGFQTVNRL